MAPLGIERLVKSTFGHEAACVPGGTSNMDDTLEPFLNMPNGTAKPRRKPPTRKKPNKSSTGETAEAGSYYGRGASPSEAAGGILEPPARPTRSSSRNKTREALTNVESPTLEAIDRVESAEVERELTVEDSDNGIQGATAGTQVVKEATTQAQKAVHWEDSFADNSENEVPQLPSANGGYKARLPTVSSSEYVATKRKAAPKDLHLEDSEDSASEYEGIPRSAGDVSGGFADENSNSGDGLDEDSDDIVPLVKKKQSIGSSKRGSSVIATSKAAGGNNSGFDIDFGIECAGRPGIVVFTCKSKTTFEEFETLVRKQLDELLEPLYLTYQTGWDEGPRQAKIALDDESSWERMVTAVSTRLKGRAQNKKTYQIRLFSPLNERQVEPAGKKKKIVTKDPKEGGMMKSALARIMEMHKCCHGRKDHQCFMITEDDNAPAELVGKCLWIPNDVQATWGAKADAGLYGVAELPLEYRKQLITAEMERRAKSGEPMQKFMPKPRGMNGSTQIQVPGTIMPHYQQSFYTPNPYGPYAPIVIHPGALDSPTKRALGISGHGLATPKPDLGDTPLEEWLNELDAKAGTNDGTYVSLWPALSREQYAVVLDVHAAPEATLAHDAKCSPVLARRLKAKARTFLRET